MLIISSLNLKLNEWDYVNIDDYNPNNVAITTHTAAPTILMLTDVYYPGWEVYVDEFQTTMYRADGIFRAIELPAGDHDVEFIYKPKSK